MIIVLGLLVITNTNIKGETIFDTTHDALCSTTDQHVIDQQNKHYLIQKPILKDKE